MKQERVLKSIERILQADRRGLTIQEIAHLTHTSRITAALVLAKLEGAGRIDVRRIGNCKLHYWRDAS
jgi:predicted transcriptional regulator